MICDDLDGYVARTRNMTSTAGGYFDLLTDILHITYLIIALAFAGFVSFEISIFLVPVYALIIFTAMNYILYLKEFLFPRLGFIEEQSPMYENCIWYKTNDNYFNREIKFYKKVAKYITKSNVDDGVAYAIEKLLEGE